MPDHLAVLDLEPDERRQVHRLAEHLVVLLVVDQNLKQADAYFVSTQTLQTSLQWLVLVFQNDYSISCMSYKTNLGFARPRGILLHRVIHDLGFPEHLTLFRNFSLY